MTTDAILVLNAGSSSLKFSLYDADAPGEPVALSNGQIEGLGTRPRLIVRDAQGQLLAEEGYDVDEVAGHPEALARLEAWAAHAPRWPHRPACRGRALRRRAISTESRMFDRLKLPTLEGKRGLVIGIANDTSIAWGCAKAFRLYGPELAVTYLNDRAKPYIEPLAKELDAELLLPLDVEQEGQMAAVFDAMRERWGGLDLALHSIAYAPKEDVHGRVVDCSRGGFHKATDVSCYSFIELARFAEPLMADGGTLFTMSYYGAEKVVENYNIMVRSRPRWRRRCATWLRSSGRRASGVHAISPGPLATRGAPGIAHFNELLNRAARRAPAGRLVSIEEVRIACAALATDDAKLITGDTLYIDGGFHILG
jgi:enoyl-[acyl-carrier protein] reductase I